MADHLIGTTLSKSDLKDKYDAIIVGSGIGGLTTAAILAKEGPIYGINHTPERFSNETISFHGPINGLYLTGQDTLNVGIGANFISGALTSLAILGLREGKHLLSFFRNS